MRASLNSLALNVCTIGDVKVAIITCYFDPDYVRSRSLRAALESLPSVQLIVIKNNFKGLLRYPEVLIRLWWCRLRQRPDIYLLGFRGQEILPASLLLTIGKPLIFDEFIVPLAWSQESTRARSMANRLKIILAKISAPMYKQWLKRCRYILADTETHAHISSQLSGISADKYRAVPVGTDETLFRPAAVTRHNKADFTVFYYGNMLPLHGLNYVLEAAVELQEQPITFVLIGGGSQAQMAVERARHQGAKIDYQPWVSFDELPNIIYRSQLCLGGPFGATAQAQRVVTGKTYQFLASGAPTLIGKNEASSLFIDKTNSLIVNQGDAHALAAKIRWAYEHPQELIEIGKNGRLLYEEHFSTKAIARILQQLLDAIF